MPDRAAPGEKLCTKFSLRWAQCRGTILEIKKLTANTYKLKEVIEAYKLPLGETESGKAWCLKALHPADPITEVMGVPDQTPSPVTVLNYQQASTIINPGEDETWECELTFLNDPSIFCAVRTMTSAGDHTTVYNIHNTALGVTPVAAALGFSGAFVERWRMAYGSVTVYADGPSLANQGSVVAAQYPARPYRISVPSMATGPTAFVGYGLRYPIDRWQAQDSPGFDTLLSMPNSYSGLAKDGVYMPMKLDSNHAAWHDHRDLVYDASLWTTHGTTELVPVTSEVAATVGGFPYYSIPPLTSTIATGEWLGSPHLAPMLDNLGQICFKNLGPDVNLSLAIRMGVEVMVQPASTYRSFLHLSPVFDPMALGTYFKIARELKDAYPSDYNDLGKLWDVIKSAARIISPFMGLVPGGSLIREAASLAGKGVDTYVDRKKPAKEMQRDPPARAAVERAQALVARAPRMRVAPRKARVSLRRK